MVEIVILLVVFLIFVGIGLALYFSGLLTPSVDCELSDFGECDPVTGIRRRKIITKPQGNGEKCEELEEECSIDCVMSKWSTCDTVSGTQTRSIVTPSKNGGKKCGVTVQGCDIDCVMGEWSQCDAVLGTQSRSIITPNKNNGKKCGSTTQECVVDITGKWNIHIGGHEGVVELSKIDNTTWQVKKVSGNENIRENHNVTYIKGKGYEYNSTILIFSDNSLKRLVNNQGVGLWLWK